MLRWVRVYLLDDLLGLGRGTLLLHDDGVRWWGALLLHKEREVTVQGTRWVAIGSHPVLQAAPCNPTMSCL